MNIGELVKVKVNLQHGEKYGGLIAYNGNIANCGKETRITDKGFTCTGNKYYLLDGCGEIAFSEDMLEKMEEEKPMIKDSGNRTEYQTGAVRDLKEGKGRCDLMPLDIISCYIEWFEGEPTEMNTIFSSFNHFKETGDISSLFRVLEQFQIERDFDIPEMLLELSKHYEEGAIKYGEHNWEKGIPVHSYIDSAIRHYLKYKAGWNDEPHDRAFIWNVICCAWTMEHKPELNDFTIKEEK